MTTTTTEIPMHLIANEILPRIPVKTLLTFKDVSPQWHSTIFSNEFAKTQLEHPSSASCSSRSKWVLALDCSENFFELLDYGSGKSEAIFLEKIEGFHLLGRDPIWLLCSCDGLVLLITALSCSVPPEAYFIEDVLASTEFYFVVYNPLLGPYSYVSIHPPDLLFESITSNDGGDSKITANPFTYNFGFGHSSDDYKIVVIQFRLSAALPHIILDVYSLRSGEWERQEIFMQDEWCLEFQRPWYAADSPGVLVNKALHWAVKLGDKYHLIVTFDLTTPSQKNKEAQELIKFMKLPHATNNAYGEDFVFLGLGCMDGCLCALGRYGGYGADAEIWQMREYGVETSWNKMFRFSPGMEACNVYGRTMCGAGLVFAADFNLLLGHFGHDLAYNEGYELLVVSRYKKNVVNYIPSLVSPKAMRVEAEE